MVFNSNFVDKHLRLYILVYYNLHLFNVIGTFSFFFFFCDGLKYVILRCFHEIKYIRKELFLLVGEYFSVELAM